MNGLQWFEWFNVLVGIASLVMIGYVYNSKKLWVAPPMVVHSLAIMWGTIATFNFAVAVL